jgi:hypothetical protein
VSKGIELIAAERSRQINKEGFTATYDGLHQKGEMARAACYYAWPTSVMAGKMWPGRWQAAWAKKGANGQAASGRIRDLTKAGALIAAEIDRLLREEARS